MVKLHNHKHIGTITVLMMLTSSNLAINYVYAEKFEMEEVSNSKERLVTVVAEMVKEGKLIVRLFQVTPSMSPLEIGQVLSKEGSIVGWAIIKGESTKSGIVLYNGKTIHTETETWHIDNQNISQDQPQITISKKNSTEFQRDIEYKVIFEVLEEQFPYPYRTTESTKSIIHEFNDEFPNSLHERNLVNY